MIERLYAQLKKFGHVRTNQSIAKYTTFQIGGIARFFLEVTETKKLIELLNFLSGAGINWFILGGGSNTLWRDELYTGVVIKLQIANCKLQDFIIEAEAGAQLSVVMNMALKQGWTGLEWAAGLPGTVGGAVRGNAGAMWSDTARLVLKIEVWRDGEVIILKPEECAFGYRDSIFKHNTDVIIRVWYTFAAGDKLKMMTEIQGYLKKRAGKYPPFPSGGSFFKNIALEKWTEKKEELLPEFITIGKVPAGWIIEKAGLKGLTVGGCMVSKEHGNFLINFKNGAQADIRSLVEKIQETVYTKFKVELEPEVQIVE